MLHLVLSSFVHACECMLRAFLVGLAGGGLGLRHRVDAVRAPADVQRMMQREYEVCPWNDEAHGR
jgi:hypothetical protein